MGYMNKLNKQSYRHWSSFTTYSNYFIKIIPHQHIHQLQIFSTYIRHISLACITVFIVSTYITYMSLSTYNNYTHHDSYAMHFFLSSICMPVPDPIVFIMYLRVVLLNIHPSFVFMQYDMMHADSLNTV